MPERATALTRLMVHGRTGLDPALLGFSGDGRTTRHLGDVTRQRPITEAQAQNGRTHRLWRITHPAWCSGASTSEGRPTHTAGRIATSSAAGC
ncbi:hypothetical protein [Saccharopolyspora aridisoli]|uniref:hypothetical protein n=1 Tax=Saccharopolyspora aridisoli TaxID=2530385 RepID=UPI00140471AD|nr:hypothetical protein [Saccharopolyspora aridisoli]